MYHIEFCTKADGSKPAKEFIHALDEKMKAKVFKSLDLLEANGPALRLPHSAMLGDGILELRVKESTNISRVFYFFYVGKRIVLTHGIIKKTQKTPPRELERAKKYRAEFLKQEKNKKRSET